MEGELTLVICLGASTSTCFNSSSIIHCSLWIWWYLGANFVYDTCCISFEEALCLCEVKQCSFSKLSVLKISELAKNHMQGSHYPFRSIAQSLLWDIKKGVRETSKSLELPSILAKSSIVERHKHIKSHFSKWVLAKQKILDHSVYLSVFTVVWASRQLNSRHSYRQTEAWRLRNESGCGQQLDTEHLQNTLTNRLQHKYSQKYSLMLHPFTNWIHLTLWIRIWNVSVAYTCLWLK